MIFYIIKHTKLKGTYYAKITFIRCLNSCVAAVCENNQPIMVKIHPLIFFIIPINHKQSLEMSRFSLCTRHWGEKVPPICDALCPISINTALSEKQQSAITEDIQCQCQRGFTSVVFWDAPSDGATPGSFAKFYSERGINTNTSCVNVSSRQSKHVIFCFEIVFLKELLGTL